MRITVDTNVLVRAAVQDDKQQAAIAKKVLKRADLIAIPLSCLCEFNWVLCSVYRFDRAEIAAAMDALIDAANVVVDRPALKPGSPSTMTAETSPMARLPTRAGRWAVKYLFPSMPGRFP